ncbi:hypothetical protein [Actinoplanes regularis]|uniref:Uncharacterized protein n=1 Tax=Actinoplanes regularis TaxID=52697 RepID=A0A238XJH0_9ACTN|nr:hypothetical protein [Actinoplanes regularis]GIE90498.1 hypothetical protein Are01nite_69780 [Actinoplanes regularis]SNR58738.1 hypothetical protein SAMN06264365_103490 [Actinoplanes regularis]
MQMTTIEAPPIEPTTEPVQISAEPQPTEYGAHTFGRLITTYLQKYLRTEVEAPVYRCNPYGARPCARAQSYEFAAAEFQVTVVAFEAKLDGSYDVLPVYALFLDGERVTFNPRSYQDMEKEIALAVWLHIDDRRHDAERAAKQKGERR